MVGQFMRDQRFSRPVRVIFVEVRGPGIVRRRGVAQDIVAQACHPGMLHRPDGIVRHGNLIILVPWIGVVELLRKKFHHPCSVAERKCPLT